MRKIKVTVNSIRFPHDEAEHVAGAWYILQTNAGKCTGVVNFVPQEGDELIMTGDDDEYQGRMQFKFTMASKELPTDFKSLLHYICSRSSGIGDKKEKEIWDKLGNDWLIKAKNLNDHLKIGAKAYQNFLDNIDEYSREKERNLIIAFLIGKGCTINMAERAFIEWLNGTVDIVKADPYKLATLRNYGFGDVDNEIRKQFGIGDDDERRLRAGILYAMNQLIHKTGSTAMNNRELFDEINVVLQFSFKPERIKNMIHEMVGLSEIFIFTEGSGAIVRADHYKFAQKIMEYAES